MTTKQTTPLIAAVALVAALAIPGTAPAASSCTTPTQILVGSSGKLGYERYFQQIGTASWIGPKLIPVAMKIGVAVIPAPCETPTQTRFYRLLRSFPLVPSRAQWKDRYRPLVLAAIAADRAYLATLTGYMNGWAAGVPGELPADAPLPPGVDGSFVAGDLAWLRSQLSRQV